MNYGRCLYIYVSYIQTHSKITRIEDIELSSEERSYYMGRFGQNVVPFTQLKLAETVGKGILCKTELHTGIDGNMES